VEYFEEFPPVFRTTRSLLFVGELVGGRTLVGGKALDSSSSSSSCPSVIVSLVLRVCVCVFVCLCVCVCVCVCAYSLVKLLKRYVCVGGGRVRVRVFVPVCKNGGGAVGKGWGGGWCGVWGLWVWGVVGVGGCGMLLPKEDFLLLYMYI
jgi:hypothetical protein